ncbi:Crp/Fnr family transcriptional regulator, partial [Bacteroides salyersiae]
YTFSGEFTGSLCTLIEPNQPSLVTIEAVCDTKICYIPYLKVEEFFATNVETMQVKCTLIEQSYLLMYHRLIDMYCKTTAELYLDLLNRCPDIQEYITLKEIASFLQVTPETISRIRRGLNK